MGIQDKYTDMASPSPAYEGDIEQAGGRKDEDSVPLIMSEEEEELGNVSNKHRRRSQQTMRRQGWLASLWSPRTIVEVILALLILGLLLDRYIGSSDQPTNSIQQQQQGHEPLSQVQQNKDDEHEHQHQHEDVSGKFEGNGDITGFAPRFAHRITSFHPYDGYAPENASEFFTNETQQRWLDLVPTALGYVKIKEPKKYENLPQPLTGKTIGNMTVFTTSMTHQLHCLHAIIDSHSRFLTNKPQDDEMAWHMSHCFEYLRQSIMCCGDVALEGDATTFPEGTVGSDGWDAQHVCKDYGQVYEYLEENRAGNRKWI